MECNQELFDKLLGNFDLLCGVIRQKSADDALKVDLSQLEELIDKKIPEALKRNSPENFFDLYTNFKSEGEKFRSFILYDKLIGKNIIALGGGFSCGKSSFLNTLMGKNVLPADITPSTSVPTFILQGKEHEVVGVNIFDAKVQMKPRDIRRIAHGFGELGDDDEAEKVTEAVTLGHILNNIFFSTPLHKYANIAFLDTPGYSKPDSKEYSARTDEQIARGQLNTSNYILWFIQSDAGTITEEDCKFIKTLREDIPKLVILNKADKKNLKDLKEIIARVKSGLELKGIRFVDVFAFSCKPNQIDDDDLRDFLETERVSIEAQINEWNQAVYDSSFARNFKQFFVKCKEFYEARINEETQKLEKLNTSIMKLQIDEVDSASLEQLKALVRDAQRNVNDLKTTFKNLRELQDEFFTEIKYVSDEVGIAMPEPSEIDLIQEKTSDPLVLLNEYIKKSGIRINGSAAAMLKELFADSDARAFKRKLLDVLTEVFSDYELGVRKNTKGRARS